MFRNFIKSELQASNEAQFLLIGEDHIMSSGTIGFAHCLNEIKNSPKKVILIPEALIALPGSTPYTVKDLQQNLSPRHQDYDALKALIEHGITVYGFETPITAPGLFLQGNTVEEIFEHAKELMASVLTEEDLAEFKTAIELGIDAGGLKMFLNLKHAEKHARITVTNQEILRVMLEAAEKNPANTLVVFVGGSAHLAEARFNENDNLLDEGVIVSLKNKVGENRVQACFFNCEIPKENSYQPRTDERLHYGLIPNRFQVPDYFVQQGSELYRYQAKKYQNRLSFINSKVKSHSAPPENQAVDDVTRSKPIGRRESKP